VLEGAHLPGEGANSDAVFGVNRSVWSRCFGELLIALKSRRMLNRIRDRHTRNGSKAHEGGIGAENTLEGREWKQSWLLQMHN
jgi:hypothetical protein